MGLDHISYLFPILNEVDFPGLLRKRTLASRPRPRLAHALDPAHAWAPPTPVTHRRGPRPDSCLSPVPGLLCIFPPFPALLEN